jgi:hypothetical protein
VQGRFVFPDYGGHGRPDRRSNMDIFADQGKVRAIYHVSVGVSDIERARRFYSEIFSPLGYKLLYKVKE